MFNFERLEVWQKAIEFADRVYSATRRFPSDERFGLTNQMRRAAVSISCNISEGSTRNSGKDFARFIEIAMGPSQRSFRSPLLVAAKAFWLRKTLQPFTQQPKNKVKCSAG